MKKRGGIKDCSTSAPNSTVKAVTQEQDYDLDSLKYNLCKTTDIKSSVSFTSEESWILLMMNFNAAPHLI